MEGKWNCPLCKREIDISGTGTAGMYKEDIVKFHLGLHARHIKEDLVKAIHDSSEKKELPPAVAEMYTMFTQTVEIIGKELSDLKIHD